MLGAGGRTAPPDSTRGWTFGWMGTEPTAGMGAGWIRFPDIVTLGGGPSRLVRRLRIPLSDMLSRAVTGGIRTRAEGSRLTSDFMSDSSSSSWLSTANKRKLLDRTRGTRLLLLTVLSELQKFEQNRRLQKERDRRGVLTRDVFNMGESLLTSLSTFFVIRNDFT